MLSPTKQYVVIVYLAACRIVSIIMISICCISFHWSNTVFAKQNSLAHIYVCTIDEDLADLLVDNKVFKDRDSSDINIIDLSYSQKLDKFNEWSAIGQVIIFLINFSRDASPMKLTIK